MTAVTRLIGAPGSGKTHRLLDTMEDHAADGVSIDDMRYFTFSRAARSEAEARIADRLGIDRDTVEPSVRTIHSEALRAVLDAGKMNLSSGKPTPDTDQIIRTSDKDDVEIVQAFFAEHFPTLEFEHQSKDPLQLAREDSAGDLPTGNQVIAAYNYVNASAWDFDDYQHAPVDVELPPAKAVEVMEEWEAFKERNNLWQDDDYVHAAADAELTPPGDVLLIDEFQDLAPVQYRLYKVWRDSGQFKDIYIGGDENQAIYGFRGAAPEYFTDTRVDDEIRQSTSYRCPSSIIEGARPLIEDVDGHTAADVSATEDGGVYKHVSASDNGVLADMVQQAAAEYGEVYLLTRTNRQAGKVAWALREEGVPYLDLKPNGNLNRWRDPMPALLEALRAFDAGRNLHVAQAQILLQNVTVAPSRETPLNWCEMGMFDDTARAEYGTFVDHDEVQAWFPNAESAAGIVRELNVKDWRRDMLADAIRSGSTNDPGDVRIGTLHAAKGLEAPAVALFPEVPKSLREDYEYNDVDTAGENRLFYVGVTRAERACYVAHDFLNGSTFPPLES
jgi:DNA helicase-2/ATP-dependent DNA helicase PcrA